MATMKAVLLDKPGPDALDRLVVGDIAKPTPGNNQFLVKVEQVAINPVDFKMAEYGFLIQKLPVVLGCDVVGTVEAVGPGVSSVKVGDKVYGWAELGTQAGAFAEYSIIDADFGGLLPAGWSAAQGTTIGVGTQTAFLALFTSPKRPPPSEAAASGVNKGEFVVIWGAAGGVGVYAVQLAAAAGYTVVGVCSAKSSAYVKKLGAAFTVDYNAPDAVDQIKAIATKPITLGFDLVGPATASKVASVLASSGQPAVLSCIAGGPDSAPANVTVCNVNLGNGQNNPEVRAACAVCVKEVAALAAAGKLQSSDVQAAGQGLAAIPAALRQAKAGVSGVKLVVTL